MSNIAIKAENLSKAYQLGEIGTGTISRDLERWYARMRGKEDPFLRIGETNDRTSKGASDIVWSLKDINFEIEQGDAVGIIGRNGAGKSTLLKVLSRVTSPTSGRITGKGRIASLLEVGTGFHPELTGRENIYLNGAILGMRKKEITRKFDEIVDFAGVERYIDTPVKRYSSGMYVRLAFAVAAHLESAILIVDEVLAVGDAEFQKKCLGKMGEVSKGEGRTVLFVSHNMGSVKALCNKGFVLNNGALAFVANNINEAVNYYAQNAFQNYSEKITDLAAYRHKEIAIESFTINGNPAQIVKIDTSHQLDLLISGTCNIAFTFNIELKIFSIEGVLVAFYSPGHFKNEKIEVPSGKFTFSDQVILPENMTSGEYLINIDLSYPNVETYYSVRDVMLIKDADTTFTGRVLNYNDIGFYKLEGNG